MWVDSLCQWTSRCTRWGRTVPVRTRSQRRKHRIRRHRQFQRSNRIRFPASPSALSARPQKRKPQQTEKSFAQAAEPTHSKTPAAPSSVATPNAESQVAESSFRESAKEFASGFGKGIRDEGERIYRDTKELPARIAKTGRELVEDVREGRKLRALAPIEAMGHAIQTASRDDVERLAQGVVDSARDWYHKPAKEKGESIGRATMSIASDAAIAALTDGLGTVAGLRKAEKAAEAAEHVRDAERVARAVDRGEDATRAAQKATHASQVSGIQRPGCWASQEPRSPARRYGSKMVPGIDVENPNPGKRPGQIHFQQGKTNIS